MEEFFTVTMCFVGKSKFNNVRWHELKHTYRTAEDVSGQLFHLRDSGELGKKAYFYKVLLLK